MTPERLNTMWSDIEMGSSVNGNGADLTRRECEALVFLRQNVNNLARLVESLAMTPVAAYYAAVGNPAPLELLQMAIKDIDTLIQRKT
jgi:hypothetical protein